MGYIRHHAIVVTASYYVDGIDTEHWIDRAHRAANLYFGDVFAHVSAVTPAGMNDTRSFFVSPDGSKEGWDDSEAGNQARRRFIRWLRERQYDDKSSPLSWVEVQFGDDDLETTVVDDSDADRRAA